MAERHLHSKWPLTLAFQEKANSELTTLNNKLHDKLKEDITRIYTDSLFADLDLLFGSGCIRTHRSLLETRAPNFYKELVTRDEKNTLSNNLTLQLIESFIRQVYKKNVLKHKEDAIIRYLKGEKEQDALSPESDVFLTPNGSPSDPHFRGQFSTDTHTAYYSLVPQYSDNQSLERELAEQDELSKSFRSILIKETQQKPCTPNINKSKNSTLRNDAHRKTYRVKDKQKQVNSSLNSSSKSSKLFLRLRSETYEMSNKVQAQKEDEIMSNPDSCLEAVSSGYVTGCSPRDTNGSEALGADTTEVATSDDIPHDDKSRGSSSVSSDPGTWDSTFPTNDDDTCIERENIVKSDSTLLLKEADDSLTSASLSNADKPEYDHRKHDNMCNFTENSDSFINLKIENKYSSPVNSDGFNSNSSVSNNFFIDASSLRDENEMYLPSICNPVFPSTIIQPKTFICDEKPQNDETNKSDLDVRKLDSSLEDKPKNNVDCNKSNELVEDIVQSRKLIRRNTFDLDPDDETLTRLKEEYTKNEENNKNSIQSIENSSLTNVGFESKKKVKTSEEDTHSPDSLNNDFHVETFLNTNKVPKEKPSLLESCHEISSTSDLIVPDETKVSSTVKLSEILSTEGSHHLPPSGVSSEYINHHHGAETNKSDDKSDLLSKDNYFNKLECTPIVSGGSIITGVPGSQYSSSASPMTKRKTEFAPILSGGFHDLPSPEEKKPKQKISSALSTSWVVDMSDVGKSPPESLNEIKMERNRSNNSGMGFFVPLDDPYPSFDSFTSNSSTERSDSSQSKRNGHYNDQNSSCGFFIDLKDNTEKDFPNVDAPSVEKKLFSMFIDIGNSKSSDSTSPKSKPGSPFFPNKRTKGLTIADRLSAKHFEKKSISTSSDSGLDLGEHPEIAKGKLLFNESSELNQTLSDSSNNDSGFITKRQSFYMFIGNEESPVARRRTLPAGAKQNPNRHSWNNDYKQPIKSEPTINKKEHKRSSSISYDQTCVPDNFSSGPTSIQENIFQQKEKKNKSLLSSWHGPIKPTSELSRIIANGAKQEFKEKVKDFPKSMDNNSEDVVDKGEEMSSSIKSDEVFDISNATVSSKDGANRTFIVDDVSKAVNVNTNDLELSTPSHDLGSDLSKDESVTDPVQEIKSSSSNATNKSSVCDADANTPKPTDFQQETENTPCGFVKLSDMDKETSSQSWKWSSKSSRMSRSIPEGSWIENKVLTNSVSSRSLSRLFPHLYQNTESTEASLQSSVHSSIPEPSPLDVSTEEEGSCESGAGVGNYRLGEDLLRMFLDEISPDVTVEVGGRRIKAHKCILSSRCQYFAGMLSGGWVESAGNVISLQGFSYSTVHFALCHIYSGASQIPDSISIVELATLADMLCLEGLKEVIMYTLKVKYCHFFHKPCSGCLVGVVECLPVAAAYSLDEIYRKSLRWITKHFVKVWPTKGFASLPKELHDKCFKQHVVNLCCENILETVMGCGKLDATIPNVRWASPVLSLNSKLHDATVKYLSQNFSSVLASQTFLNLGREDSWTVTRLEETLIGVSKTLSPDQACQSYRRIKIILANINKIESEETDWKIEFLELLTKLEVYIEECLIRQAGRAARTTSWSKMELSLRRKIQEAACLVFAPGPRTASAPRDGSRASKTVEIKPKSPGTGVRKVVSGIPAPKTTQSPLPKPKTPKNLSQVKSRYLEPKGARKEVADNQGRRLSGGAKPLSSSDSSRTSSPATARVSRPPTSDRRTPIASRRINSASMESPSLAAKEQRPTTSKESETKNTQLKRQSTFRVATKSSSAKQVNPAMRTSKAPTSIPAKSNVINNNNINSRGKQTSSLRSAASIKDESSHLIRKTQHSN